MRAYMWSRALVVLSLFSLSVQAAPPDTQEQGTRVFIRLAQAAGELPEPEKVVQSIEAVGGEHQVVVRRQVMEGQQELTVDLWGATVPQADIPQTLREAFPVLASADIQVSSIDPKDHPKPGELIRDRRGEKGTVKKVVKIIKKE